MLNVWVILISDGKDSLLDKPALIMGWCDYGNQRLPFVHTSILHRYISPYTTNEQTDTISKRLRVCGFQILLDDED